MSIPWFHAEFWRDYDRYEGHIDFQHMADTFVIVAGLGTFSHKVLEMTRAGVRDWWIFDPDPVEHPNIVSQHYSVKDVGCQKAEALQPYMAACAPDFSAYEGVGAFLGRKLEVRIGGDFLAPSDAEFVRVVEEARQRGLRPVFIMTTDFHLAQARGARLAIKLQVPILLLGIYRGGMAAELLFWLPGHDLACPRCIARTRYEHFDRHHLSAFRQEGKVHTGRSRGLPAAASFIDAVLLHLLIGIIHWDDESNPHARLVRRLVAERRNFIQCQMNPEYRLGEEDIFASITGPDVVTFNTIFQHGEIEPDCPDCQNSWSESDYSREAVS